MLLFWQNPSTEKDKECWRNVQNRFCGNSGTRGISRTTYSMMTHTDSQCENNYNKSYILQGTFKSPRLWYHFTNSPNICNLLRLLALCSLERDTVLQGTDGQNPAGPDAIKRRLYSAVLWHDWELWLALNHRSSVLHLIRSCTDVPDDEWKCGWTWFWGTDFLWFLNMKTIILFLPPGECIELSIFCRSRASV